MRALYLLIAAGAHENAWALLDARTQGRMGGNRRLSTANLGQLKLTAADDGWKAFGRSVAIDGDTVVIGASFDGATSTRFGDAGGRDLPRPPRHGARSLAAPAAALSMPQGIARNSSRVSRTPTRSSPIAVPPSLQIPPEQSYFPKTRVGGGCMNSLTV